MAVSLEYFPAAGTAVADGVFIPIGSLDGLEADELGASISADVKAARVMLSILVTLRAKIADMDSTPLGYALAVPSPVGTGENLIDQDFQLRWRRLVKLDTQTVTQLPLATTGDNSGKGSFDFVTIFAGVMKVSSGDSVEAGIVIPTANVASYSGVTHATLSVAENVDAREYFCGLFDYFVASADVRSATKQSAITETEFEDVEAVALSEYLEIPEEGEEAEVDPDPVTGLSLDQLRKVGIIERLGSITIELKLTQSSQAFNVNSIRS